MPTEAGLVNRLVTAVRRGRRVALVLGPGITAGAVPGPAGMVDLADRFASERIENPDLAAALAQARAAHEGRPMAMYLAYRRAFAEWVSPSEFDIVLQHAVLPFQPGQLPIVEPAQRPARPLGRQRRRPTGPPGPPPVVDRLQCYPQPTRHLRRGQPLLEQLGGLQPHRLTLGPALGGQATAIGIPHTPGLPDQQPTKPDDSTSVAVVC